MGIFVRRCSVPGCGKQKGFCPHTTRNPNLRGLGRDDSVYRAMYDPRHQSKGGSFRKRGK